jgi:uncharacterized protein with HEPN domain
MERDPEAFLMDIVDAADAIYKATGAIELDDYRENRMIRSSVEREFTIIGEALTYLSRLDKGIFERIPDAPRIISFRNKLLVWGFIETYLKPLRDLCLSLAEERASDHP